MTTSILAGLGRLPHRWRFRRVLELSLLLILAAAWFVYLRPVSLGGPASYVIVSGPSMEPALHTGDLAVLHKRASYASGDIVAFRAEGGLVIHRVTQVKPDGYVTKGDNKEFTDPWLPQNSHIAGSLLLRLPGLGGALLQAGPMIVGGITGLLLTAAIFAPKSKAQKGSVPSPGSELVTVPPIRRKIGRRLLPARISILTRQGRPEDDRAA